ncbi:MAG: hypothetical protein QOK37_1117 [Thermoanaerobaculia bacterium]|jgi:hypothetical protein|nr:hypothetical protein [Thermoanaerobaculia bacterium]
MNISEHMKRGRHAWLWLFVVVVVVFSAAALVVVRQRSPKGPRLLNQPTKAREVRPFSERPDPRFAPLPIQPEKHGK